MKTFLLLSLFSIFSFPAIAQSENPKYNKSLADSLGSDDYGMKQYVLVILKTGSNKTANRQTRDSLFKGHMANIGRLAKAAEKAGDSFVTVERLLLGLTLGGSSLLYLLIQRGAATAVTSLLYLVPPCTALMAWLLFAEPITALTLAGGSASTVSWPATHVLIEAVGTVNPATGEEICRVGKSLFDRGLVHATAGNISVRLDDGFLITPTDACLGLLDPARLALVDAQGRLHPHRRRCPRPHRAHRAANRRRIRGGAGRLAAEGLPGQPRGLAADGGAARRSSTRSVAPAAPWSRPRPAAARHG